MKNRLIQFILIILAITAIAGSYFYFQSRAAMTVNQAGLTSVKLNTAGLTSIKINTSQAGKLTNGLVGHWTFDGPDTNWTSATAGTVTDRSGQGNTGTLTGMSRTTSPVPGKVGQALNFNGSSSYIDIGFPSITSNITVSAWVYNRGGGVVASNFEWDEFIEGFEISMDGNKVTLTGGAGWSETLTSTDAVSSLNQWHHIIAIRRTSPTLTVTFYIDGAQDSGGWQNWTVEGPGYYSAKIGANGSGGNFFNGYLDEVRIYDRALSASEITELYNMGK